MKLPVIQLTLFFRWYDLWVGVYIDAPNQTIYICPIPCFGIKIRAVRWEVV